MQPWFKTPLGRATLAAAAAVPPKKSRRAFSGAQASNLTWSWVTQPTHLNAELQKGLRQLRARSRDLEQNNDYARKFLSMVETNVVGHAGFSLFIEPKRPDGSIDQLDAAVLERGFWQWAQSCEVTGLSLAEVERLFIRTVARDGDVAVRYLTRGPFGFQIQMVDPQRIDDQYNDTTAGGRKIRMGVEYDEFGAPAAYYLSDYDSADPQQGETYRKRLRVPADQLKVYFPRMSIGQLRGVPFMSSAMLRLQMLGGYEEAAVVAARVGAAKMGAIKNDDGDVTSLADAVDSDGNAMIEANEPGGFFSLPPGAELQAWDPDYPHAQYDVFVRACVRGISSGLGVSYATLANDLENVNYSSIRAGVLEEREVWKGLQGWMIEAFLQPLYTEWLRNALTTGALDPLPASKFAKFNSARWQGRRWDWVDPKNDMEANILAIKHGLKSRTEIVAEQGRDLVDVWSDLKREQEEAAALGIRIEDLNAAAAAPKPAPEQPARPDDGEGRARAERMADERHSELIAALRKPPEIHVHQGTTTVEGPKIDVHTPESRTQVDVHVPQQAAPVVNVAPAAPEVRVDVNPTPVEVNLEANLPPAEVTVNLPPRRTETTVERNARGDIVKATQIERDAD